MTARDSLSYITRDSQALSRQDVSRFGQSHGECVVYVDVVWKCVITNPVRCYGTSLREGGGDAGRDSSNVTILS